MLLLSLNYLSRIQTLCSRTSISLFNATRPARKCEPSEAIFSNSLSENELTKEGDSVLRGLLSE